jgi:hypothetical protein
MYIAGSVSREMIPLGNGANIMDALSTVLSATNIHSWRGTLLVPKTKSVKLSRAVFIRFCMHSVMHLIIICLDLLFYNYSTMFFFKYSFNVYYLVLYIYFLFYVFCVLVLFCVLFLFSIYLSLSYFYKSLPTTATEWKTNCSK